MVAAASAPDAAPVSPVQIAPPILTLHDVRKTYGTRPVLRGISLAVPEGRFVSLLGPSGCGKTTLLNAIAGLTGIDGGRIAMGGATWSDGHRTLPPESRRIGMVFQDFALWPHMTVFANVAFGLKVQRLPQAHIRARVAEVLRLVQMDGYEHAHPRELSGGQKQRVAIARALANRPRLLLMDEPLSNLDARLREDMRWDLLSILRGTGTTTIYVTHDQTEAMSMADHVVLLNGGVIEQHGPPAELHTAPRTAFAATFLGASNILRGRVTARHGDHAELDCDGIPVRARCPHAVGTPATVAIRPAHVEIGPIADDRPCLSMTVRQRIFQGATWQYRLQAAANEAQTLECWSDREFPEGALLWAHLPPQRCTVIED